MGHYYFHLCDGSHVVPDPEGVELMDLEAARRCALAAAHLTLSQEIKVGGFNPAYRIDIEDESGTVVHSLPLRHAAR